jgi:hypothetical protein
MYWNIMDMLKILKFKSDFLCSNFVVWIFSCCTYVDYVSQFNNPYSNFHLNKYWKIKNIYIYTFQMLQGLCHPNTTLDVQQHTHI